jgi:hypothetical protein
VSDIRETADDRFGICVKERRWVNIVYRRLSGQAEGCHEISIRRTVALIEIPSTVFIPQWISGDILFR